MKDKIPGGLAFRDEDQLDQFLAKANEEQKTEEQPDTQPQTEEEVVEQKARQGGTLATTIRQKRLELSEAEIEKRISQITAKYPQIDEVGLREAIALRFEQKGRISEADLVDIQNSFLRKVEKEREQEQGQESPPLVSPPPIVANTLGAAGEQAGRVADWASSLKTPGGIGLLLGILFFFIWVIVPVSNGKTRMQLLWGVLTGQVQFRGDVISEEESAIQSVLNSSPSPGTGSGGMSAPGLTIIPVMPTGPTFEVD